LILNWPYCSRFRVLDQMTTHDLVIRLITKYLYRENPTLVNLHLINRRYYGLRKVFEKQLAMVILKLKFYDPRIRVTFHFLSPYMNYQYSIYDRQHLYSRTQWISFHRQLLTSRGNCIYFGIFDRPNHDLFEDRCRTYLPCSIYGKAFDECLSDIINDPRCWD